MNSTIYTTPEKIRSFFLVILFLSIPFSIAGGDFAITGLYLITIYLFIRKKEQWQKTPILPGVVILLLGAALSSLFSADIINGFVYFRSFWRFGLPFLVLFAFKNREMNKYLSILAVISSLIAIYAVIQFSTGLDLFRGANAREEYQPIMGVWYAVGFFSHHLTYGGVSLLLFSMMAPLGFCREYSTKQRVIFGIGSILNLAAVVVCMGRSIWLGAAVAAGILVLFQLTIKRLLYLIMVVVLVVSGLVAFQARYDRLPYASTAIGYRLISIMKASMNKDRLMMWQAGVNIIRDHPLLGLGPNSGKQMSPYYEAIEKKEKTKFQHNPGTGVHNIYIQNWINFGLIGLIGYLLWWILLLVRITVEIRKDKIQRTRRTIQLMGILAGLMGCMVAGIFLNNFRDGEVQTMIFVAMGLGLSLIKQGEAQEAT